MRSSSSVPTIPWAEHGADLAALLAAHARTATRRLGPEVSGAVLARPCRAPRAASGATAAGERVLDEGAVLTPAVMGMLVALGIMEVAVHEPFEVLVVSGAHAATAAACGASLRAAGAAVTTIGEDRLADPGDRTSEELGAADLLVTVGHAEDPLRTRGLGVDAGLIRVRLAQEPGGIQGIGTLSTGTRHLARVDLPADPVAALVVCETLLRPTLRGPSPTRFRLPLRTDDPIVSAAGLRTALATRVLPSGSLRAVGPSLAAFARADALAVIPEETTEVRDGDLLDVSLLPARRVL